MNRIYLLIIFFIMLPYIMLSQVMYNISKPYSYHQNGLKANNELPLIHFPINEEGNLIENNINLNIKDKAIVELINNKYVSRFKIKVFAEKLGMMSIIMDKVVLNNNSYCYVYTPDYQIVAGPIYQSSINEYIVIRDIPTDELIVEIISNSVSNYELNLSEVDYVSMFREKRKSSIDLQKNSYLSLLGLCISDSGRFVRANNVKWIDSNIIQSEMNCNWLGAGLDNTFFKRNNFLSVNELPNKESRSSCIIMCPFDENDTLPSGVTETPYYEGINGTLINFPYHECDSINNCGAGIIISDYHQGVSQRIVLHSKHFSYDSNYMNKVIIRFNSHHRDGIPWHLENVNCWANEDNFCKWRKTIDFNEIVDYIGVEVFLYEDVELENGKKYDFVIYNMKQRPFFKELHLGWSTQTKFDKIEKIKVSEYGNPRNDCIFIGRRGAMPTQYLIPLKDTIYFGNEAFFMRQRIDNSPIDNNFSGYSSSILMNRSPLDTQQFIGLGLAQSGDPNYIYIQSFNDIFNLVLQNSYPLRDCHKNINQVLPYIMNNYPTFLQIRNYEYIKDYDTITKSPILDTAEYYWVPSIENQEKCPSQNYIEDSCKFNISQYIIWNDSTNTLGIDSIPANLFPGGELPKGYRLYYNYKDQKTLDFDPFNDNSDIKLPANITINDCDKIRMLLEGKDSINLAIDFYDEQGRILNNNGCKDLSFTIPINIRLCDLISIASSKVLYNDTTRTCTYLIELTLNECFQQNPLLHKLLDSLKFKSFNMPSYIAVKYLKNLNIDYNQGTLSFNFNLNDELVEQSRNSFVLYYGNRDITCITDSIDFSACRCACPEPSKTKQWITSQIDDGEANGCSPDECRVTYNIDIPAFYGCYNFVSINNDTIPIIDNKATFSTCVKKGGSKTVYIRFTKGEEGSPACLIEQLNTCEKEASPCTPNCESTPWYTWTINNLPIPGCPGCVISAKYVTRYNSCDNKQEIQVMKFYTHNIIHPDQDCLGCNYSEEELYKLIIKKAIFDNPMGFEPKLVAEEQEKCDTTWRVVQGTCWVSYKDYLFYPGGVAMIYKPCDSVDCCSIGLKVCRFKLDGVTHISIDTIGGTNSNNCIGITQTVYDPLSPPIINKDGSISYNYYKDIPCQSRCNWLYSLTDSIYFSKQVSQLDLFEGSYSNDSINYDISLTSNETNINLTILSRLVSKDVKISISNLRGENILNKYSTINKGINQLEVPINNLLTGIYFLSINIDGILYKTEKITILR